MEKNIREQFPGLEDFAQRALNTRAENQRGELEVLMDMSKYAQRQMEQSGEVDWPKVRAAAACTLPKCSPYLSSMTEYLQTFGGSLLADLDAFFHTVHTSHHLAAWGGELFDALNSLAPKAGEVPLAYVTNAVLKAQKVGTKIQDGICRTISVSSISKIRGKAAAAAREAEECMAQARDVVKKLNTEKTRVAMHQLDIRTIVFLLQMKNPFEDAEMSSLEDITEACLRKTRNSQL